MKYTFPLTVLFVLALTTWSLDTQSIFGACVGICVPTEKTAPYPPYGLDAKVTSSSSIKLTWSAGYNGGSPITGYMIERESPINGGFTTIVENTGTTTTSYSDTGLTKGTEYNYRVSAINSIGTSSPSNEDAATIKRSPK